LKIYTRIIIAIILTSLFSSCTDTPSAPVYLTRPITENHSSVADPYTRWKSYNLKNYMIEQRISCFCPDVQEIFKIYVWDKKIIDVIKKSDGKSIFNQSLMRFKTVDDLFQLVSSINPDNVAAFTVEYDQRFGFPKLIYIDADSAIADEEYTIVTSGLERLLN
jgi:Family of unknown function (DUF6174)